MDVNNDLPTGFRWSTEEETEQFNAGLRTDLIVVKRTADAKGVAYTQDEADLATPLASPPLITDEEFFAYLENDYPAVEFSDYEDEMFFSQVRSVADALRTLMMEKEDDKDLAITVGFESDPEGLTDGVNVGMYVPGTWSTYLVRFLDIKNLTDDRSATGKDSALAIKSALMREYVAVREIAYKHGLIA